MDGMERMGGGGWLDGWTERKIGGQIDGQMMA